MPLGASQQSPAFSVCPARGSPQDRSWPGLGGHCWGRTGSWGGRGSWCTGPGGCSRPSPWAQSGLLAARPGRVAGRRGFIAWTPYGAQCLGLAEISLSFSSQPIGFPFSLKAHREGQLKQLSVVGSPLRAINHTATAATEERRPDEKLGPSWANSPQECVCGGGGEGMLGRAGFSSHTCLGFHDEMFPSWP